MSLGLLHQLEGKVQEACADYEKALTADPSNAKAKQLFSLAVEQFSMTMYDVCKHTINVVSLTLLITLVVFPTLQSLRQSSYNSVDSVTNYSQTVLRIGLHRDQNASDENVEIDFLSLLVDLESVLDRHLSTNGGVATSVDLFSHISKKHTITII